MPKAARKQSERSEGADVLLFETQREFEAWLEENHATSRGIWLKLARKNSGVTMNTEWVEVRSCTWLHEARFVRSVLEAAGIETVIPNEHTLDVQPGFAPALGGVRVLVRPDALEAAEEVLEAGVVPPPDADGD